jgi:hypothetical protein
VLAVGFIRRSVRDFITMVASFTHLFFCNLVSNPVLDLLNCVDVFLIVSHLALSLDLIRLDLYYPFGL